MKKISKWYWIAAGLLLIWAAKDIYAYLTIGRELGCVLRPGDGERRSDTGGSESRSGAAPTGNRILAK